MMAVVRDAAQEAVRTSARPYSNVPLTDYSFTPEESVTEKECPLTSEVCTEQAAAMQQGKESSTETSPAGATMDKGGVDMGGLRSVVDIRADASSAASHNCNRR